MNSDAFIEESKGHPPLIPWIHRDAVVSTNRYVDETFINDDTSLESCLVQYQPNFLAIGSDWAYPRDYMTQIGMTFDELHGLGTKLVFIPTLERVHSSAFKRKIGNG